MAVGDSKRRDPDKLVKLVVVVAVLVATWAECSPCNIRPPNFGVRNGVSTYSLPSRSVSGLGTASVTGDRGDAVS